MFFNPNNFFIGIFCLSLSHKLNIMKGRLELIGDWWYVRYTTYDGGGSFRLLLHPNFVTMTDYVWVKGIKVYNGDEVEFTQVLVNPMGREVDPNDLGKNLSKCKWYAKPSLVEKEDSMMEVPMAQYPKDETKKLFTDYPITELGDEEFKEAPIRECELLFYDDNKYCYVKVGGIEKEIKRAYIYTKHGRCGEVDCISIDEINKLIEVNKQKQHLIDMMESDEELGLYDETIDSIKLEEVFGSKHCLYSVIENKLSILYRNQEKILSAIKILNNGGK
jgi:hypothetical protein